MLLTTIQQPPLTFLVRLFPLPSYITRQGVAHLGCLPNMAITLESTPRKTVPLLSVQEMDCLRLLSPLFGACTLLFLSPQIGMHLKVRIMAWRPRYSGRCTGHCGPSGIESPSLPLGSRPLMPLDWAGVSSWISHPPLCCPGLGLWSQVAKHKNKASFLRDFSGCTQLRCSSVTPIFLHKV